MQSTRYVTLYIPSKSWIVKIFQHNNTTPFDDDLVSKVGKVISGALRSVRTEQDQFIVNDTPWYGTTLKRAVANRAEYISKTFQKYLDDNTQGSENGVWRGETTILQQSIDGYGKLKWEGVVAKLRPRSFIRLLTEYCEVQNIDDASVHEVAYSLANRYIFRSSPVGEDILESMQEYLDIERREITVRVGVEFETGNLASAFRALNKLGVLYQNGEIDLGVFVCSENKSDGAARIWPSSNRNGSFEELVKRRFREVINYPLLEFGFLPDGFDRNAKYLAYADKTASLIVAEPLPEYIGPDKKYQAYRFEDGRKLYREIESDLFSGLG